MSENPNGETVEEFGEALRQIAILVSGMDPSDGEGTSGNDVLEMVQASLKDKDAEIEQAKADRNRIGAEVRSELLPKMGELQMERDALLVQRSDLIVKANDLLTLFLIVYTDEVGRAETFEAKPIVKAMRESIQNAIIPPPNPHAK